MSKIRNELGKPIPADPSEPLASPDDPDLAEVLAAIDGGDRRAFCNYSKPGRSRASHGPDGQTPLHAAAWCNDDRLAVMLLAYGADPEAKYGQSGHTPLSWAVTCDSQAFAKTLVRLGQKPDLFCAGHRIDGTSTVVFR